MYINLGNITRSDQSDQENFAVPKEIIMESYNVLVIDDEEFVLNMIMAFFEKDYPGYNLITASNGEYGIEMITQTRPELVITDWDMPILNGIEIVKKIKTEPETKDTPVIMMTGKMTSSDNLKTALDAGAIDFIRKPLERAEFTARVNSMLLLSKSYRESIRLKNNELANTTLKIVQNNAFYNSVKDDIKKLQKTYATSNCELNNDLQELKNKVSFQIQSQVWEQFYVQFSAVQPVFHKVLTEGYPHLTAAEIKLATLLRLNMNTKDIATMLYQTVDSIRVARTRLRKKLNLNPEDNLISFLMAL